VTSRTTASTIWPPRPDGTERESTDADDHLKLARNNGCR
jgi:hypothetical protein